MKELFQKGLSYRTFLMNLDNDTRGKFMKYYIGIDMTEERRNFVKSIQKGIKILGVLEAWCPDCHINLPALEKLISINKAIELRLVLREGLDFDLSSFEENGKLKVPTFIFMDEEFNVVEKYIEKPSVVKQSDINTLEGSQVNMKYKAGRLMNDILDEFTDILEKFKK